MASEANMFARSMNSTVTRPGEALEVLRSLETNDVIDGFPGTLGDIQVMGSELALFP
ncbi:hypothetical protein LX36DRAFT_665097 [Colletotrichum falcatum]|nr:hypothetical protein LX36DRAFT_665097 [Colletotrichum falcatum]